MIRELKLNTGKSFWMKHVTQEDFFEVRIGFHFTDFWLVRFLGADMEHGRMGGNTSLVCTWFKKNAHLCIGWMLCGCMRKWL